MTWSRTTGGTVTAMLSHAVRASRTNASRSFITCEVSADEWEATSSRDGTPLPLHVARMLACDAARIDVSVGESGEILDVGRSRRTIPTAIGRALTLRDGGCRVPGCGRSRHVQAHHVEAWAEGGATRVSNLVLLCPGHHWLVHEGSCMSRFARASSNSSMRMACGSSRRLGTRSRTKRWPLGSTRTIMMAVPIQRPCQQWTGADWISMR